MSVEKSLNVQNVLNTFKPKDASEVGRGTKNFGCYLFGKSPTVSKKEKVFTWITVSNTEPVIRGQ